MESDWYKVRVLHYLNPHLLWVEVDRNYKNDQIIFEQIGIYGIVPLNSILHTESEDIQNEICEQWLPVASELMTKFFSEATEVWFNLNNIDIRNSIFDNNIHKFGEIIKKNKSGYYKKLSKLLIKYRLAINNTSIFYKYLSWGKIITTFNQEVTADIINIITKNLSKAHASNKWKIALMDQTSVFHLAQNIVAELTVEKLEYDKLYKSNADYNIADVHLNKLNDLKWCKGIDLDYVGRATTKIQMTTPQHLKTNSSLLSRKLEMVNQLQEKSTCDNQNISKEQIKSYNSISDKEESPPRTRSLLPKKILQKLRQTTASLSTIDDPMSPENHISPLSKTKKPDYLVAFGPPGVDPRLLTVQVASRDAFFSRPNVARPKDEIAEPDNIDKDFVDLDSEVNLEITNRPLLTESNQLSRSLRTYTNDKNVYELINKPNVEQITCKVIEEIPRIEDNTISNKEKSPPKTRSLLPKKLLQKLRQTTASLSTIDDHMSPENHISPLSKTKKPDYLVASGPPGVDPRLLTVQVASRDAFFSRPNVARPKDEIAEPNNIDKDFVDLDSEVNLEITNRSLLTESNQLSGSLKTYTDDKNVYELINKPNLEQITCKVVEENPRIEEDKVYANPFRKLNPNVFVDKGVTPVLMVHNKMNKIIQPSISLRDVNFNTHIKKVLKDMKIEQPMTLQKISWFSILRGYSLFMVSPSSSGKTLGYIPAVCRLISDFDSGIVDYVGPICIIVCATAKSVTDVERLCNMFLGVKEKVISCYAGMDEGSITTSLSNGCDLFICTPCVLVRLLHLPEFGVDMRRLSTFVLHDCERLSEVYSNELKFLLNKVKESMKKRSNKELKVQFILASRVWCKFMEPLAEKAPNTVICIGAPQECVLYSNAKTTVDFIKSENKISAVLDFLSEVDQTKKTVIVCRSNEEIISLEKVLNENKYVVFASNTGMDVHELYNLNISWNNYQESVSGPILLCRDENLAHFNVTDAHNLLHYSLPRRFSMFCKRFYVLNENYVSLFKPKENSVTIKILLDDNNMEQLPKILYFIKRCTDEVPEFLNGISEKIVKKKDIIKASNFVPLCDALLSFGYCPEFWNCNKRHTILKVYDKPKDWLPNGGEITFKILHYHTAVLYSARVLSHIGGVITNYGQNHNTLSSKLIMYYSNDRNKRLHGIPNLGDFCAASLKHNKFARCQIIKIINYYPNGNPNYVQIKLIDEEICETSRDIDLYYLPDELKNFETHVVQVRLANIQPKDKDVTFSDLATNQLRRITEEDNHLYIKGKIAMSIGNCIFVDTLEACQDLSALVEPVVRHNFKEQLLEKHAVPNPQNIINLRKLCEDAGLDVKYEKQNFDFD